MHCCPLLACRDVLLPFLVKPAFANRSTQNQAAVALALSCPCTFKLWDQAAGHLCPICRQ